MSNNIITGLDLGSSNIRVAMISVSDDETIEVLALENVTSKGIDSGNIVDFDIASTDIRDVLKRVEEKTQKRAKNICVSIKGAGISGMQAKGMFALGKHPRQIGQRDIEKCVRISSMIRLSEHKQIIQKEIQSYYINESDKVVNPEGLYSTKLGMELYVVIADIAKIKNLYRCIEHSGYILNATVFAPIAIKKTISSIEKNKDSISAIIDIGSHLTGIALFKGEVLFHIVNIESGSLDLINHETVQSFISNIKQAFANIKVDEVVFTGGGALKEDLIETADMQLGISCKMGHASVEGCSMEVADTICHTGSLGVALYQAEKNSQNLTSNMFSRTLKSFVNMVESYF